MGQDGSKAQPRAPCGRGHVNRLNAQSPKESTAGDLSTVRLMMDQYPIKLTVPQSVELYGPFTMKPRILTWGYVIERNSRITFRKCVDAGVDIRKLYNMQSDLQQWIRHDKVTLDDCKDLAPWRPNPFLDMQCNVGDLVLRRNVLTPQVLIHGGVTFELLWERFGLTPPVMGFLGYSAEHWIQLGMKPHHVHALDDANWAQIFKDVPRKEVLEGIRRRDATT